MSGRSRRSTTWRFSISVADFGSSGKPQWPHAHASCRTTRSGSATCRNVPPSWPVWPPLALPERPRRLPGTRGFFFNPSLEGGLELFELSCPNCRRRSATSASSAAICRFSAAINSSTSAGRTIPPLIQIRPPPSRKIRHPTPIPRNRVTFRTHPGLGVTLVVEMLRIELRDFSIRGYHAEVLWIRYVADRWHANRVEGAAFAGEHAAAEDDSAIERAGNRVVEDLKQRRICRSGF